MIDRIIYPPGGGGNFILGLISGKSKFNNTTNQYETSGYVDRDHVWKGAECNDKNLFIVPKRNTLKYVYTLALIKKQFYPDRTYKFFHSRLNGETSYPERMFINKNILFHDDFEGFLNKEKLDKAKNFVNRYRGIDIDYFSPIVLDIMFSEYDIDSVNYHNDKLKDIIESWEKDYEWSKCNILELDYYDIFFNFKLDNTLLKGKEDIIKKYTVDNINFIKKYDKIFGTKFLDYVP